MAKLKTSLLILMATYIFIITAITPTLCPGIRSKAALLPATLAAVAVLVDKTKILKLS